MAGVGAARIGAGDMEGVKGIQEKNGDMENTFNNENRSILTDDTKVKIVEVIKMEESDDIDKVIKIKEDSSTDNVIEIENNDDTGSVIEIKDDSDTSSVVEIQEIRTTNFFNNERQSTLTDDIKKEVEVIEIQEVEVIEIEEDDDTEKQANVVTKQLTNLKIERQSTLTDDTKKRRSVSENGMIKRRSQSSERVNMAGTGGTARNDTEISMEGNDDTSNGNESDSNEDTSEDSSPDTQEDNQEDKNNKEADNKKTASSNTQEKNQKDTGSKKATKKTEGIIKQTKNSGQTQVKIEPPVQHNQQEDDTEDQDIQMIQTSTDRKNIFSKKTKTMDIHSVEGNALFDKSSQLEIRIGRDISGIKRLINQRIPEGFADDTNQALGYLQRSTVEMQQQMEQRDTASQNMEKHMRYMTGDYGATHTMVWGLGYHTWIT